MKPISIDLQNHLAGENTTLATCLKLTRKDNVVMRFTSHDQDIIIDSVTYMATTGITPDALLSDSDLSIDRLNIESILMSDAISEQDLMAGLYDYAEIEVFLVNYHDLSQGILPLRHGWLGKVVMDGQHFTATLNGLNQTLDQEMGELYSPSCRANLGDDRCKIAMSPTYTKTGIITSVTDHRIMADNNRTEENDFFTHGKITFTSGENNGISMEVKRYTEEGGIIELVMPIPYVVTVGNSYSIQAGCDRTFSTCINRFNNALNFRGEPHVPGIDKVLETAGTRNN